jgi:predicted dehydrogenase
MDRVNIGVVGCGSVLNAYGRLIQALRFEGAAEVVAAADIDPSKLDHVRGKWPHASVGTDYRKVVSSPEVDLVMVLTAMQHHGEIAKAALRAGKHVLVEKPIASTLAEADDLIAAADSRGAVLQVGHIERFNPATDALCAEAGRARFIEVHRLGSFSPRSLDIDVVLDLMIHDLDILLGLDGSELVQVDAVGVPVLTAKPDIANVRLRFASGLIANLTASRVSAEKVRKFRAFAPSTYVSADLVARQANVFRLVGDPERQEIAMDSRGAPDEEPLRRQLAAFLAAVEGRGPVVVSGADGRRVLALAQRILAGISSQIA